MTIKSLDERIEKIRGKGNEMHLYSPIEIRQLIKDVLVEVVPEKKEGLADFPDLELKDDEEYLASNNDFKVAAWQHQKAGHNACIDQINDNIKELGL